MPTYERVLALFVTFTFFMQIFFHLKNLQDLLECSHCFAKASMQKGGKNGGSLITTGSFCIY